MYKRRHRRINHETGCLVTTRWPRLGVVPGASKDVSVEIPSWLLYTRIVSQTFDSSILFTIEIVNCWRRLIHGCKVSRTLHLSSTLGVMRFPENWPSVPIRVHI